MPTDDERAQTIALLGRMIAVDSRSFVSNVAIAELMEAELDGWEVERIDYVDPAGTKKRNLVAVEPGAHARIAFAGHLDTVSDAGWVRPAFTSTIENEKLYGLGACDMKGPVAAFIVAIRGLPRGQRPMIVLTADEEVGKQGVRETVSRSVLLRDEPPSCFVVAEPTTNGIVRGHRVDIQFVAEAKGLQAHSSTGKGENANIRLIPFLSDMRALHLRLRSDPGLQDRQYDPPFCDLNMVVDNHGAFPNMTVGLATCRMKFRYSKSFDPAWVVDEVQRSARHHGLELTVKPEASPPELPPDHPLVKRAEDILGTRAKVAGLGTEASEYSRLAPTIICGPGDIAHAHGPEEHISIAELAASIDNVRQLAAGLYRGN